MTNYNNTLPGNTRLKEICKKNKRIAEVDDRLFLAKAKKRRPM